MHQQGSKLDASAGTHNIDGQSSRRADEEGSRTAYAGLRWGQHTSARSLQTVRTPGYYIASMSDTTDDSFFFWLPVRSIGCSTGTAR